MLDGSDFEPEPEVEIEEDPVEAVVVLGGTAL